MVGVFLRPIVPYNSLIMTMNRNVLVQNQYHRIYKCVGEDQRVNMFRRVIYQPCHCYSIVSAIMNRL